MRRQDREGYGSKVGVVAFAFGSPATIRSNAMIAEMAALEASRERASVFTQADIQFTVSTDVAVTYCKELRDEPPSTLQIARQAIQWAVLNQIDAIGIVCAKPHLWRCLRDMRAAAEDAGVEWMQVYVSLEVTNTAMYVWFCSDSTQPRTRSQEAWERRERFLRRMPFWLYKIVVWLNEVGES